MNMTVQNFTDVFTPLLLALHENGALNLTELPYYYEDVLVRRKMDRNADSGDLEFLQEMIQGLHRLSASLNHRGGTQQN